MIFYERLLLLHKLWASPNILNHSARPLRRSGWNFPSWRLPAAVKVQLLMVYCDRRAQYFLHLPRSLFRDPRAGLNSMSWKSKATRAHYCNYV